MKITHFEPIKGDARYTATLTWCGHSTQRWVARFCGEWIGQGRHHSDATMLCIAHHDRRQPELNGETAEGAGPSKVNT